MTAGLTVFMDQGVLQLDSSMKTSMLVLRMTYTGPYTTPGNMPYAGTWYYFTITVPANVKYLCFSSPNPNLGIALFRKSGTSHEFVTNIQGTIDIYGFADGVGTSTTNSGLQLFDESGTLTFDSDNRFMRISDTFVAQPPGYPPGGVAKPWPSSTRKYAAGIGFYGTRWQGAYLGGAPWGILATYGLRVGPTEVYGGETWIYARPWGGGGDPAPTDTPRHPAPTVLVIDVTDL